MTYLVTFVDKLMSSSNKFQTVHMIELRRDFITEEPTCSTRRNSPGVDLFRIRPDEITESTFVGNLLSTGDHSDLINRSDFGTQATVHTQDFAINHGSENQEIENLAARLPYRGVSILLLTFFIKAIDLGDLAGFVVTTDESDPIGVSSRVSFGSAGDWIYLRCLQAH